MESLQSKQALLRTEVIEAGIDAENFMEFIGTVKGEGENIDLDNWTIQELRNVVIQFRERQTQQKQELMNSRAMREIKKTKIFEPTKKEKAKYEGTTLWDYEIREEQECAKSKVLLKIPSNARPYVKLEKPEIKSVGGFLFGFGARNELEVTISCNFVNQKVVRRGEDCDWLRRVLIQNHPGCYVPPLEIERELDAQDKKGIAGRVSELEKFLNAMLAYPVFHTSRFVREFFEQPSPKKFLEFKTREQSFPVEKDVDVVQSPEGTFLLQISDRLNKTLKGTSAATTEMNSLFADVGTCAARITLQLESVNKNLRILGDLCAKIGEKYSDLQRLLNHDEVFIPINEMRAPTMLLSLNNTTNIYAKNLRRNIRAFSEFTEGFIKTAGRDWTEMFAHDKRLQGEQRTYLNFKENLIRKKEKWVSEPTKWELPEVELTALLKEPKLSKDDSMLRMFPADNDRENRMRIWLSFVNQNYLRTFKQFLLQQENDLLSKFLTYSGEYLCLSKETSASFVSFREMILE